MKTYWLGILGIILLTIMILLAGCSSQPSSSQPAGTVAAITETPTVEATTGTLMTEKTAKPTIQPSSPVKLTLHSITDYVSDNQFSQPNPGYEFILVDFSITNNGLPNGYRYSPFDVKVRDPDNYEYQYHSHSYSVPGCFDGSVIYQGETRRGKLIFEVPIAPAGTRYTVIVRP